MVARGLLSGDFNGDGRPDLATANYRSNDVSLLLGNGNGTFFPSAKLHSNPSEAHPVHFRFDADNIPDLVVLNGNGEILFRAGRRHGIGDFAPPVAISNPPHRRACAFGEVNRQIVAVNQDDSVTIYKMRKNGKIREVATLITGTFPGSIAAGDLNGDGREDLVVANILSADISIFLARNGGYESLPRLPVGIGPAAIELDDLDGNGFLDIVVTNATSGDVSLLSNRDGKTFEVSRFRAGTGLYGVDDGTAGLSIQTLEETAGLAAGDFNEDGFRDLVVYNQGTHGFVWLPGSPGGGFANPIRANSVLVGTGQAVFRAGHFNPDQDKHFDLIVLDKETGMATVFLGRGNGQFVGQPPLDAGHAPTGLTVQDVNKDQRDDLLIGNDFGDVLFLLADGQGGFQAPPPQRAGVHFVVRDLNGDQQADAITASEAQDLVRLFVRQPGLTSFNPVDFAHQQGSRIRLPGNVHLHDLNRDGRDDLIVVNSGRNNVLVFLRKEDGTWDDEANGGRGFGVGHDPGELVVAQLNDDNDDGTVNDDDFLDVLVTNRGSNDVSVLFGAGAGDSWTLNPGPRMKAGPGPVAVRVEDVDVRTVTGEEDQPGLDGIPDLIVTSGEDGSFTILSGIGNEAIQVGSGFFRDQGAPTVNVVAGSIRQVLGDLFLTEGGDLFNVNFANFTSQLVFRSPRGEQLLAFNQLGETLFGATAGGSLVRAGPAGRRHLQRDGAAQRPAAGQHQCPANRPERRRA